VADYFKMIRKQGKLLLKEYEFVPVAYYFWQWQLQGLVST